MTPRKNIEICTKIIFAHSGQYFLAIDLNWTSKKKKRKKKRGWREGEEEKQPIYISLCTSASKD